MATPLATRVKEARQRVIDAGGRRLPSGMLKPDAAQALAQLLAAGYSDSEAGVIAAALLDARKKMERMQKTS